MAQPIPGAQATNISHPQSTPEQNVFRFEAISFASTIRFDPDEAESVRVNGIGSQSSLSSSLTPETLHSLPRKNTGVGSESHSLNDHISVVSNSPSIISMPPANSTPNEFKQQPTAGSSGHVSSIEAINTTPQTTAPYQAPSTGRKLPGKLTTQYVMPDGSVITGKGLGRGRPGVKRGPRKPKLPGDESMEGTPTESIQTPMTLTQPSGSKRKRADSESSNVRARSVSSSLDSRESSVEYNPTATQTRSGRQTQKPIPIIAASTPSATASPATKKIITPVTVTPTLKTHPKIKRKVYRGKEQFALCEHCLRGFGPSGNVIVFCDACNHCWHQRCHQPQISKEIVADSQAEWFCASCDKILHGNKKSKKTLIKPEATPLPPPPPPQKFGPPLVGAIALTIEQRRKYLETLSRDQMISLLLRAGEMAPQMPIFETPIPTPRTGPSLQPQFTSDYVTPVTETPPVNTAVHEVADEGYDDSYDEHAALYPKIGEGVSLPPEREDLNMLLEGPDSRTFSHWVKGMPVKTVVDTVPLHQSQFEKPKV